MNNTEIRAWLNRAKTQPCTAGLALEMLPMMEDLLGRVEGKEPIPEHIKSLREDASRYRYLRASRHFGGMQKYDLRWYLPRCFDGSDLGDQLDASIDLIEITVPEWIVYIVLIYFGIDAVLNAVNIWLKLKIRQMNKTLDGIKSELKERDND